jgi:hypothetical protein
VLPLFGMKLTMLLRIRFLPPGYANPGVVEVVLAQVREAREAEKFRTECSVDMKSNTENFKWSEFLSDYNCVLACCMLQSPNPSGEVLSPPLRTAATGLSQFRNADPAGTRHRP